MAKVGQRGLHGPSAKFLQQTPPELPFQHIQQQLLLKVQEHFQKTATKMNINTSQILNAKSMVSNLHKHTNNIPNSIEKNHIIHSDLGAPKQDADIGTNNDNSTGFTRVKSKKKKFFTQSPKQYYHQNLTKNKRESEKKLSPFLQYQKLTMSDTAPIQNQAPAITPEKQPPSLQMNHKHKGSFSADFVLPDEENTHDITNPEDAKSKTITASPSSTLVHNKPSATNVGMFTSHTTINLQKNDIPLTQPPSIQQQNTSSNSLKVSSITKQTITFRYKLQIFNNSCNMPLMVKQVTKLVRDIDPTLTILPFQSGSANDVLDHEDNLPLEEDDLKKWIANVQISNDKLMFTMKYSLLKTIKALSGPVFAWMKRNRSYVKMDLIDSEKVTCIGFFEGLHPDFRNRDNFKIFCQQHIDKYAPALKTNVSIFPRPVYVGRGAEKIASRAVVIETDSNSANVVLQAMSKPFNDTYTNVTFIPFTKYDDTYSDVIKAALLQQNKMLHTMKRKIIPGLFDVDTPIVMRSGKEISVKNWLLSATDDNKPDDKLIVSVDAIPDSSAALLYHERHESSLSCLLLNLRKELLKYFPESQLSKVFQNKPQEKLPYISRVLTDTEKNWADVIKRKYLSNPQNDTNDVITIPPQKNRKVLYYGTTSTPDKLQNNTFDNVSDANQNFVSSSDFETKLKEQSSQMESLITSNIQKAIAHVEMKMTTKLTLHQQKNNERIQQLEKKTNDNLGLLNNNLATMSSKFDTLLDRLFPSASTASPMETDDGGKKE